MKEDHHHKLLLLPPQRQEEEGTQKRTVSEVSRFSGLRLNAKFSKIMVTTHAGTLGGRSTIDDDDDDDDQ